MVTKTHPIKHKLPWYNDTIHAERRIRRHLQCKWNTNPTDTNEKVKAQKEIVCGLITKAKADYFTDNCSNSSMKDMYKTVNVLFNKFSSVLPVCSSDRELANGFLSFFIQKVETIRTIVDSRAVPLGDTALQAGNWNDAGVAMCNLKFLDQEEIKQIIMKFLTVHSLFYHLG